MKGRYAALLIALCGCSLSIAGEVLKDEADDNVPALVEEAPETLLEELERGFYSRVNLLAWGISQGPKNSALNENNRLNVAAYQAVFNPRVDLNLDYKFVELSVKERFLYVWERWEDGQLKGREDSTSQFYLNEWFARFRVRDDLFVSYGRENLQWGPSVLLSSSNPFNPQNGRNNPQVEVPGLGYARAVWIPSANWSVSFIANTDSGRLFNARVFGLDQTSFLGNAEAVESRRFKPSYALKADYTGDGKYLSIIPTYRELTGFQVGYFGGWNISDSLLLYSEGALGETTDFQIQGGVGYTFEEGQTLNFEYFHNNAGCLLKSIPECFLRGKITAQDVYWRQDYIMGQFADTKIMGNVNVNLRYIHDLNDQSNQMVGIFEYEVGANTLLYLVASGFTGTRNSEFGSVLKYAAFVGAGYTF